MLEENIISLDSIDSTNEEAKRLIQARQLSKGVIIASAQSSGKGTHGRTWYSPKEVGLYCTVTWDYSHLPEQVNLLPFITALSAIEALEGVTTAVCGIKWPNDIMIGLRKVGGILIEQLRVDADYYYIIGLGVNINNSKDQLPENPIFPASSVYLETGKLTDIGKVIDKYIRAIEPTLARLDGLDAGSILDRVDRRLVLKDREIMFMVGNDKLEGTFCGLDEKGNLVLGIAGKTCVFSSGVILGAVDS